MPASEQRYGSHPSVDGADSRERTSPGKVSLTSRLPPRSEAVQRKAEADGSAAAPPPVAENAAPGVDPFAVHLLDRADASASSSIPDGLRGRFEQSLGTDLSGVRLHTGAESATAATAMHARAYATGEHVHFGAGQYDPSSPDGQRLVAHEVAHTVQQRGAGASIQHELEVSEPGDRGEREADDAADKMLSGEPAHVTPNAGVARMIQREPEAAAGKPAAGPALNTGGKFTLGEKKWKKEVSVGGVTLEIDVKIAGDVRIVGDATGAETPAKGNGTELKVGSVGNAAKPNAGFEAELKKKFEIAALGLKPELKVSNEANVFGKRDFKVGELSFSPGEASFFGGGVKWKPIFPVFKLFKWEPGHTPEFGHAGIKTDATFDVSHLMKDNKAGSKTEAHVTIEGTAGLALFETLFKQAVQRYGPAVLSRALLPSGAVAALVGGLMVIAAANNHGKELAGLADRVSGECRNYCLSFARAVMNTGVAARGPGGEKGFAAGKAKRAALEASCGSAEMADHVLRERYKSPEALYDELFAAQYDDYWIAAVKEYRNNHWFSSTFHGDDRKFGEFMNNRSKGKGFGDGAD